MTKKHKPHSGSKAFYPKVRAKRETPSFSAFARAGAEGGRALNFLGYKAGMLHVAGIDQHEKAVSYGQEISVPATVVECPPMRVFGIRAYRKTPYGLQAIGEVYAEKVEKDLRRRIRNFKKKKKAGEKGKEEPAGKKAEGEKGKKEPLPVMAVIADLERMKGDIAELRLLAHTQPRLSGGEKKKPDVSELSLGGNVEQQIGYAKEKLGNELRVGEVFSGRQFVDVKAVDKGRGFSGVVKRAGVKTHRPKAKKAKVVGSIGPWTPATVMWTVARAGQLGYQTRTELNKRILAVGEDCSMVNPPGGFRSYGNVESEFVLLAGSVPGPAKRAVAMRHAIRASPEERCKLSDMRVVRAETEKREKNEPAEGAVEKENETKKQGKGSGTEKQGKEAENAHGKGAERGTKQGKGEKAQRE